MTEKASKQDIESQLIVITKQLLAESGEMHSRDIRANASLQRYLGIDSLGRAELFRRIEKHFQITMPDRLLTEVETLGDIATYLETAAPNTAKFIQHDVITSHGERPDIEPQQAKTLLDLLMLYGEQAPDKAHIFFQREDGGEEIITYGHLLQQSLRLAQGLRMRGLREGETVAIMQPTHPSFFYSFYGTLLAGGIPVPIYPPFRMHMLEAYARTEAKILKSADVRILITFEQAENLSRLLQAFVPSLKHVTTAEELMQPEMLETPFIARPDSFAFIQYTSGSTSDPKGVLLTHHNLMSNIRAYGNALHIQPDDVTVSWLPLYHDLGLIGMWLGSLYHGVPLILMTPFSFLNRPERWLWAIHHHRGTISGAPNFAYELCIRKVEPSMIEGLDLSHWRIAANGAEKIYPRTLEQFAEKFAPYGFKRNALYPVYGLAESTVGLILPPVGREFHLDQVDRKKFEEERVAIPSSHPQHALTFVSCGKAIEGHEVRIVDDEIRELSERHVGRLQFRGPSSMQGYYNNSVATQAIYYDGWLDSGDLAYQADSEFYITGRRKDLIIKAGRNIYPAEIEEAVGNVNGIRQGCVVTFGVTDTERGTEQLIVVAETKVKGKLARHKMIDNINEVLSTTLDLLPDRVVLVAPRIVPKTSSGKLQRAACKTMYLEGRLNRFQMPAWVQLVKLGVQWLGHKIINILTTLVRVIYTTYVVMLVLVTAVPMYFIARFCKRTFAAKASKIWARGLLRGMFCPLSIENADRLTQFSPVIFASNHASYIDSIVMLATLPADTRIAAKKELFSMPFVGTYMRKLDHLSIDRQDLPKGLEDTKHIETTLKSGFPVLIFPEGTFGYAAGLRPFRLGAFKISAETNVPICPIALQGTRAILRDNERTLRPHRVKITVCESINPMGNEWQDVTKLRQVVRTEIAKYCGEPSLDFIAAQTIAPKSQVGKHEKT